MSADAEVAALVHAAQLQFGRVVTTRGPEHVIADESAVGVWRRNARALPTAITKLLRTVDLTTLRVEALETIEAELFGWDARRDAGRPLDAATVRSAWQRALSAPRQAETLRTVRQIVDERKRAAQILKLQLHECASALPPWQEEPEVKDGVLHVRDVHRGTATFGVRSYPEATPIEVVVYVVRKWIDRTQREKPRCWDLTAGSGTVHDIITTVFGGRVISTDIACHNAITIHGDLREAGEHSRHRRARKLWPGHEVPTDVVVRPDLVFVHPPSRGWPTCAWLYDYDRSLTATSLDVGVLFDINDYVQTLADAVRVALRRLAPDGLVSLLVPEYGRFHQQIDEDRGVADALLAAIADVGTLVERHAVVDDDPVRQATLGTTRGPLEHLILARKVST